MNRLETVSNIRQSASKKNRECVRHVRLSSLLVKLKGDDTRLLLPAAVLVVVVVIPGDNQTAVVVGGLGRKGREEPEAGGLSAAETA